MKHFVHALCIVAFWSVSAVAQPGRTLKLTQLEEAPDSTHQYGYVGVTDTAGRQRYENYVSIIPTCLTYTPSALDNDPYYFSTFVQKCDNDSTWYIDYTGRSFFISATPVLPPTDSYTLALTGDTLCLVSSLISSCVVLPVGGVTNGNKGDISVTGAGTGGETWAINTGVVDTLNFSEGGASIGDGFWYDGTTWTLKTVLTSATNGTNNLAGPLISPTVVAIQDVPISSSVPNYFDVLKYISGEWTPAESTISALPPLVGDGSSGSPLEITTGGITNSLLNSAAVDSTKVPAGSLSLDDLGQRGASDGQVIAWSNTASAWRPKTVGSSSGTVTSVGLSLPGIFSVSGSPVTTSGTLSATLANQSANTFWAGPTSGGTAAPSFRAMVAADLPAVPFSKLTGATSTNSLDNAALAQTWAWSTATSETGLTMTSAALTSGIQNLHTANALTTGTIKQITTSSAAVNSTNGLLYVANTSSSTNGLLARFQANSTSGTGITIKTDNTVGIGTSSPGERLDVSGNIKVSGQVYAAKFALTDAATIAVDWNNSNVQSVTLGGNRTFTFSNPKSGSRYLLMLKQDGTGSRTVTWPSIIWQGGVAPVLTTTANKTDLITIVYDGTSYYGSSSLNY